MNPIILWWTYIFFWSTQSSSMSFYRREQFGFKLKFSIVNSNKHRHSNLILNVPELKTFLPSRFILRMLCKKSDSTWWFYCFNVPSWTFEICYWIIQSQLLRSDVLFPFGFQNDKQETVKNSEVFRDSNIITVLAQTLTQYGSSITTTLSG